MKTDTAAEIRKLATKSALSLKMTPKKAEMYGYYREMAERKRQLGSKYLHAVEAARFIAACLSMKRLPKGANRVLAQDALCEWLPAIPPGERAEILASLRKCSPAQLGPELTATVADAICE